MYLKNLELGLPNEKIFYDKERIKNVGVSGDGASTTAWEMNWRRDAKMLNNNSFCICTLFIKLVKN
jgi:hypothetical protein